MIQTASCRAWVKEAVREIEADAARSSDTHLLRLELPEMQGVRLYLKDESTHPTGSLKHRLARSLFLYGLCSGWIRPGRPVIEASSGSTAISEAYFARLLGLPFIAVVPGATAQRKIDMIVAQGAKVHLVVCASDLECEAQRLARACGGHFLDQFTFAERATDWRGNNNIAESLFSQMRCEPDPVPSWVVVGAGTGGTSATIGRYVRYTPALSGRTRLCVVDPEGSAFFPSYRDGRNDAAGRTSPAVEGIGRPRVEASFLPGVIDCMISVPDAASVGASLWLERRLGRRAGPSTGANIIGALSLAAAMRAEGRSGSIVTLICDSGERYADTIYDEGWRGRCGLDSPSWSEAFAAFERSGNFVPPSPLQSAEATDR